MDKMFLFVYSRLQLGNIRKKRLNIINYSVTAVCPLKSINNSLLSITVTLSFLLRTLFILYTLSQDNIIDQRMQL